jgi:hypothetical protein
MPQMTRMTQMTQMTRMTRMTRKDCHAAARSSVVRPCLSNTEAQRADKTVIAPAHGDTERLKVYGDGAVDRRPEVP